VPAASSPAGPRAPAHICIVRRDLPLGTIAAQLIHAAGASSPGALPSDTRAIALMVANEAELAAVVERLERAALPHVVVREPDPPWSGALMAIGIPPFVDQPAPPFGGAADPRAVRRVTAKLSLLR
jgi:hypothetical protein